jgi:hypothetical protein
MALTAHLVSQKFILPALHTETTSSRRDDWGADDEKDEEDERKNRRRQPGNNLETIFWYPLVI